MWDEFEFKLKTNFGPVIISICCLFREHSSMTAWSCATFVLFRINISPDCPEIKTNTFQIFFSVRTTGYTHFWFVHSYYFFSELWNDELQSRKKRKDPFSPDKKKPVVVSDILSLKSLIILVIFTTIWWLVISRMSLTTSWGDNTFSKRIFEWQLVF